ncbi:MAG: hypothetical protein EPO07_20620 [Verrucomicrobia bacterium]|nr:MAG: hypothetical protein EPO07_20620 [Verrucomicrobiota bacterium]
MSNYVSLEQSSQLALDKMSQELRQARGLTDFSPTRLRVLDADNLPVEFFHDAGSRTVMRVAGGATNNYLTDCDSLQFSVYQHTVQSNTFECYNPLYLADARVIQITWVCSRKILGAKANTESVQSARVAFRNRN